MTMIALTQSGEKNKQNKQCILKTKKNLLLHVSDLMTINPLKQMEVNLLG